MFLYHLVPSEVVPILLGLPRPISVDFWAIFQNNNVGMLN